MQIFDGKRSHSGKLSLRQGPGYALKVFWSLSLSHSIRFHRKYACVIDSHCISWKQCCRHEISQFLKIHTCHAQERGDPGMRDSGSSSTKLTRVRHKLSNATEIIRNGLRTSAHEHLKVGMSKSVVSRTLYALSQSRNTSDWRRSHGPVAGCHSCPTPLRTETSRFAWQRSIFVTTRVSFLCTLFLWTENLWYKRSSMLQTRTHTTQRHLSTFETHRL